MVFVDTNYNSEFSAKELHDLCGAIAENAIDAARRAAGRERLPKTADDVRKREMIHKILDSLQGYEKEFDDGSLTAPVQVKASKRFDDLEAKLADALILADDLVTDQRAIQSLKKAAGA